MTDEPKALLAYAEEKQAPVVYLKTTELRKIIDRIAELEAEVGRLRGSRRGLAEVGNEQLEAARAHTAWLREALKRFGDNIEKIAFEMKAPNAFTPRFIEQVVVFRTALQDPADEKNKQKCEFAHCISGGGEVALHVNECIDDGAWRIGICQSCADAAGLKDGDDFNDPWRINDLLLRAKEPADER